MTWHDVAIVYEPNITLEEVHDILWEYTAYSFAPASYIFPQLYRMLRIRKRENNGNRCWCCLAIKPYHRHPCLAKELQ